MIVFGAAGLLVQKHAEKDEKIASASVFMGISGSLLNAQEVYSTNLEHAIMVLVVSNFEEIISLKYL